MVYLELLNRLPSGTQFWKFSSHERKKKGPIECQMKSYDWMPNWPKRDVISVLVVFWRATEGKKLYYKFRDFPLWKSQKYKKVKLELQCGFHELKVCSNDLKVSGLEIFLMRKKGFHALWRRNFNRHFQGFFLCKKFKNQKFQSGAIGRVSGALSMLKRF